MEALLKRLNTDAAQPEDLWADLENLNESGLDALTRQVSSLEKKVSKSKNVPSSDEEEMDEDDGEDYIQEDDDENEDNDDYESESDDEEEEESVDFDNMDPKEQLRLLMEPCENDPDFSDDEDQEDGEEDDMNFEDDEEDEEEDEVPGKKRVKFNILDANGDEESDGSDNDHSNRPQSAFERQQAKLRRTISALEAENIAEKDWALRGEVRATQRPSDSLLQEDLEFEHVAKMAPTVTAEVTESIEELIKRRIKDKAWDDRVEIPLEVLQEQQRAKAKKLVELDDSKSKLSLAQQYEADFQAAQKKKASASADLKDDGHVDEETKAAHEEIRKLFGRLCRSIDGLAENKFAPRTYELADMEVKTIKK